MDSSLIWPLVALAGGAFLAFCGISTLVWWRKRARWEQCVGTVKATKRVWDEGILNYCPIIEGSHGSEHFEFVGEALSSEPEVGSSVNVTYDPATGRYFDYHPISLFMAIVIPTTFGIGLFVLAWILYQNK